MSAPLTRSVSTLYRRTAALALAACVVGTWLVATVAQDAPLRPRLPALLADATAPAIDRGLRDLDPPRLPARGTAMLTAANEGDAATALDGSVILKFRSGTTLAARRAILSQVGGTPTGALSYATFDLIAIDAAADPERAAQILSAQPEVEYAQARYRVRPAFVPNDPLYPKQWNYPAIDMERAWDINPGATASITVAVLDSGMAYRSGIFGFNARAFRLSPNGQVFPALGFVSVPFAAAPELGDPDRFVAPRDLIWDNTTPLDLDGHGTHVSGIIGQLTNNGVGVAGMAFNVRLMPVKVVSGDWDFIFNSPFEGTDDVVARGIRYAVDHGARVLNLSIGRTGRPAPVVQAAIASAVSRGAFVVVAAGNGFERGNAVERLAEFAPEIDGMVAVGAIGRDRERAFYSSTGPYVELVAPGGDSRAGGREGTILQQTFDFDLVETYFSGPARYQAPRFDSFAFEFLQGTSMAAPHVAGFAALLMQQGITSPAAIEAIMKRYATDLGSPGRDDEYGYGLINPRAALRGLGLAK